MTGPRHRKPSGRVHRRQQHCDIDGCEREFFCRHWCSLHYNRWHNFGDPLYVTDTSRPPLERFMEQFKVNPDTGCWEWQGHVIKKTGYASFKMSTTVQTTAQRAAWTLMRGPIPEGFEVDHLCCVRHCVNPEHLEPVPQKVNVQRIHSRRNTCKRGHPYSGSGKCVPCANLRARDRRAALKAGLPASLKTRKQILLDLTRES